MVPCYMSVEFVNTNEWIYAYIPVAFTISVRREEITYRLDGNRHSGQEIGLIVVILLR